ncbi:MAG: MAE_28990/MAE_18760 family HEPN-like nuclease [Candidatus Methanoperedens sp.]
MIKLEKELLNEIDWRTNELSIIRTIPLLCNCTNDQIRIIEKYSVVAIYSIWEGFVVTSFNIYIRELNNLNLTYDKLNLNILTHDIDIKFDITNERNDFNSKSALVNNLHGYFSFPINITTKIPTESNVNYKVITKLLKHYNLEQLPEQIFKKSFDKLLTVRNHIAHGDNNIPVDKKMIQEFNFTVIEAMHEVTNNIINGFINKTYLKK